MREDHRSGCPINLTLEVLGDRWTLLIRRDIIFGGARRFRELLRWEERIASNILADRLRISSRQACSPAVAIPIKSRRRSTA
jgi:DNA-binding HxlR family transcriptional regulator